jgi:hypothetical protein
MKSSWRGPPAVTWTWRARSRPAAATASAAAQEQRSYGAREGRGDAAARPVRRYGSPRPQRLAGSAIGEASAGWRGERVRRGAAARETWRGQVEEGFMYAGGCEGPDCDFSLVRGPVRE